MRPATTSPMPDTSGEMEAFAARFEPLRPMVFRVACRLVGENDAEDVVMETFLKAWQALPGFHARASLKTWLFRIAWNCANDHWRRRQRERRHGLSPDADSPDLAALADSRPSPADLAADADDAARVRHALALLPEAMRTTLLLRYADDLSYREIAAATGVRIGTVMSRLFQARRRLRRLLAQSDLPASRLATSTE